MTNEDVKWLIARPGKIVVRSVAWTQKSGGYVPPIFTFESAIRVGMEILEAVSFRAGYRDEKVTLRGQSVFVEPPKFECALFLHNNRIAAFDTNPGQRHTNKVGEGRPYFNQTIDAWTHEHIWTGEEGYVEPIEPPILDVITLLQLFAQRCNLDFQGPFAHPLAGAQGNLLL